MLSVSKFLLAPRIFDTNGGQKGQRVGQRYTYTQLAGGQLKLLKDEAVHVERKKRSKRIKKQEK